MHDLHLPYKRTLPSIIWYTTPLQGYKKLDYYKQFHQQNSQKCTPITECKVKPRNTNWSAEKWHITNILQFSQISPIPCCFFQEISTILSSVAPIIATHFPLSPMWLRVRVSVSEVSDLRNLFSVSCQMRSLGVRHFRCIDYSSIVSQGCGRTVVDVLSRGYVVAAVVFVFSIRIIAVAERSSFGSFGCVSC